MATVNRFGATMWGADECRRFGHQSVDLIYLVDMGHVLHPKFEKLPKLCWERGTVGWPLRLTPDLPAGVHLRRQTDSGDSCGLEVIRPLGLHSCESLLVELTLAIPFWAPVVPPRTRCRSWDETSAS